MLKIHADAFSSGQISSKLWLCEKLEDIGWSSNITHLYGGWHGLVGFLLLSRNKFIVNKIKSFDIDPSCQKIADTINQNWVWQEWRFKAFTEDCNNVDPTEADLTINTSTEHFHSDQWFANLPTGRRVILQSNDMIHEDHHNTVEDLDQFINCYPLAKIYYADTLRFDYPTWGFNRFMLIGIR